MIRLVEIVNWLEEAKNPNLQHLGGGYYSKTGEKPATHQRVDGDLVRIGTKTPSKPKDEPDDKSSSKTKKDTERSNETPTAKPLTTSHMAAVANGYGSKLKSNGRKRFEKVYSKFMDVGTRMERGKPLSSKEAIDIQKMIRENYIAFQPGEDGFTLTVPNGTNDGKFFLFGNNEKINGPDVKRYQKKILNYLRSNGVKIGELQPDHFRPEALFESFAKTSGDKNFGKLISASSGIKVDRESGTIKFQSTSFNRIENEDVWANRRAKEWEKSNPNLSPEEKAKKLLKIKEKLRIIAGINNKRHQMLSEIESYRDKDGKPISIATFKSKDRTRYTNSLWKSMESYMKGCSTYVEGAGYRDDPKIKMDFEKVKSLWKDVENPSTPEKMTQSMAEILKYFQKQQDERKKRGLPFQKSEISKLCESFTALVELNRKDRKCIIPVHHSWEGWDLASLRAGNINPNSDDVSVDEILKTYKFIKVDMSDIEITETADATISVKLEKGAGNNPAQKSEEGFVYKDKDDSIFLKDILETGIGQKREKTKKGDESDKTPYIMDDNTVSIFSPLRKKRQEYKRAFEKHMEPYMEDIREYFKLPPDVNTSEKVMKFLSTGRPKLDKKTKTAIQTKRKPGTGYKKVRVEAEKWVFDRKEDIEDTMDYAAAQNYVWEAVYNRRIRVQPDAVYTWGKGPSGLIQSDGVMSLAKTTPDVQFLLNQKGFKRMQRYKNGNPVGQPYKTSPWNTNARNKATSNRQEMMSAY